MKIIAVCWDCDKKYDTSKLPADATNIPCPECGGIVVSNSGKMKFYIDDKQKSKIKEKITMTFKELFPTFIAGTPIKRKAWKGYWVYKYGRIEMHTKEGKVVDFLDTKDVLFTISGILEDDWEIATNENCEIEVK